VTLDIFSRRVVGWLVADTESATLFRPLFEDARNVCRRFFDWYNQDHHHAGIGLMTPNQVHFGQVDAVHAARQVALDRAFAEHPARFVNKAPVPFAKPTATWINRPTPKAVRECRPQS